MSELMDVIVEEKDGDVRISDDQTFTFGIGADSVEAMSSYCDAFREWYDLSMKGLDAPEPA